MNNRYKSCTQEFKGQYSFLKYKSNTRSQTASVYVLCLGRSLHILNIQYHTITRNMKCLEMFVKHVCLNVTVTLTFDLETLNSIGVIC